jgi:hypothetical protein
MKIVMYDDRLDERTKLMRRFIDSTLNLDLFIRKDFGRVPRAKLRRIWENCSEGSASDAKTEHRGSH